VKRSNRLVILVGVLLAVLAFVGIVVLLSKNGTTTPAEKQTVNVLVAKADIAIGDAVTPNLVEVKPVNPDEVSGTRFGDPSQLTGAPALYPIAKGAQVSQEAVGAGATGNYCISCQLQPGEKAIAFQVDPVTGLDFLIQPGDHIDIVYRSEITVLQPTADSAGSANPRFEPIVGLEAAPTVKTLLQNKRVLYVSATKIQPIANPNATPAPGSNGATTTPIESVVVVFAGTDADAELIKFAQTDNTVIGKLTAILRGAKDDVVETTTGITLKILIDTFGIPIPQIVQIAVPAQ
jgi:Flp pilus assembly protein CpaB